MGHAAQGGRVAAPIFKQFAQVAFKDMPKIPFVAPPGIRMVRIDRASGKRVFGSFPTDVDPKSSVIWEAFQPETEPRRAFRRSLELSQASDQPARPARPATARRAVPAQPRAPADSSEFLQRQGGIY
jgi:penicillin-binding protein 1A